MTPPDTPNRPALIALDWGTTSLRAYLTDANGSVLQAQESAEGILNIQNGDFESVFERTTRHWRESYDGLTTIASGMIGSRQGWLETPYIDCPADSLQLAQHLSGLRTAAGPVLWLAPGVCYRDENGVPDVMRGEETQIIGQLGEDEQDDRLFVLPGTHSKWVTVRRRRITSLLTFMSGELFSVLQQHSILGRLMEGDAHDAESFSRGVSYSVPGASASSRGGLLKRLFSTRTLGLFNELPASGISAYLSGLIIGSEISEGLCCLGVKPQDCEVSIIGKTSLCRLYSRAFAQLGGSARPGADDTVVRGLFVIAKNAQLLPS